MTKWRDPGLLCKIGLGIFHSKECDLQAAHLKMNLSNCSVSVGEEYGDSEGWSYPSQHSRPEFLQQWAAQGGGKELELLFHTITLLRIKRLREIEGMCEETYDAAEAIMLRQ